MDNRGQFTFYRSFWEAVQGFPKKYRCELLCAIIQYCLFCTVPEMEEKPARYFEMIRPDLDREIRESREGRNSVEYKVWRAAVFQRDNFTCQVCNARGVRLNAHHLKSYAYHRDLRFEVSNGVTLCEPCHKLIHKIMRGGIDIGLD